MGGQQMKVGVWFYGLDTALTGILDIAWGAFDRSHQPIKSLGKHLPGQPILAYVASVWLIDVLVGISFGVAQQLMLVAPAAIVYASTASPDSLLQKRAAIAARWMLGLPPVIFGLFHLTSIRIFASIVPHWMRFGYFWAALTGIAFILAGSAICSGILDVLAARLLALMLLLFEGFVEIPPIFIQPHNQAAWGAAVYNVAAIGACLIFAEFLASREDRRRIGSAENVTMSRRDPVVA